MSIPVLTAKFQTILKNMWSRWSTLPTKFFTDVKTFFDNLFKKILNMPTSFAVATVGEVLGGARVTGSVAAEATRLVAAKKSRLTVTYWPTPSMPS